MLATVEVLVELLGTPPDDEVDDEVEVVVDEEVEVLELDEEVVAPSDLLALRVTPWVAKHTLSV